MSIKEQVGRVASTVVAILQTRLELASVELEVELVRFFSFLVATLIALFCAGVAVALLVFLVIALFWDTNRIGVLVSLIGLFSLTSAVIVVWLRKRVLERPRLFEYSIAELKKDVDLIHTQDDLPSHESDQHSVQREQP